MIFTLYNNAFDNMGIPQDLPWVTWLEYFGAHEQRGPPGPKSALDSAKNGPAILFGDVPEGQNRSKSNVLSAYAVGIDLDEIDENALLIVLGILAPYTYAAWTTHKHRAECVGGTPRIRIVLPFADAIPNDEFLATWEAVNKLIGNKADKNTKDISRLHYLPSTFDLAIAEAWSNEGKLISQADLPRAPVPTTQTTPNAHVATFIELDQVRAWLLSRSSKLRDLKESAHALASAKSFAEPGERHETILKLTWRIVEKFPEISREIIERLFSEAFANMPAAPDMQEVANAFDGARQKIEKASPNASDAHEADALEEIAAKNGCTVAELERRWILTRDDTTWFLDDFGEYQGPFRAQDDKAMGIIQYLGKAPIDKFAITQKGARRKSFRELLESNGGLISEVVPSLVAQRNTFDHKTSIFHEAVCPLRPLTPEFNDGVDQWLRLLGGPHYGKLVDWLSVASDLEKIICSIYFDGSPGSGKTLFAYGVSRLWTTGNPAEVEDVLASNFNEELIRCPLILADEEIPKRFGRATVTTQIRSMLSTTHRSLKRKYRAPSQLKGAVRLILAANNEFLLDGNDVSSAQDLTAIAQRFMYIYATQDTTAYLESVPRKEREYWGAEGIAKHALYLRDNHVVAKPGKRFYVEGDVSEMHRLLMTGSRWNSFTCEWLVRYLMEPKMSSQLTKGLLRSGDGSLLINSQAVIDGWDLYLKTKTDPETAKIGAALRAMSKSSKSVVRRFKGKNIKYWDIDVEHVFAWADRHAVGDIDTMKAQIEGEEEQ